MISLALLRANVAVEASTIRAGVARVNLTPPLEMKAALGGYGARMSKPAIGEHDAIWAKALVLAQDERKFALVTADVLAFPPGFKAAVIERLVTNGWSANQVMLLASHSHTSIDMMAPDTAMNRWPFASGWVIARRCRSATSRTSTTPK